MFQQLLERIAAGLKQQGIPYMVIGGQAMLLYGEPRLTKDIDITLGVGLDRLAEVLELVARFGWKTLAESPAKFVEETMVLPCLDEESGIRIDLIFSHSEYERQAMERIRVVPIGKAQVRFASVEDLIIHKIIAGRPRDLEDVRIILLKNPGLELEYIRRWLGRFAEDLSEPFLQAFDSIWKQDRS